MKILVIFSECLVAAALTVYSISDPWFHSPVGYFLLLMIFTALFFGFFTYGTANALKRMGNRIVDLENLCALERNMKEKKRKRLW